SSRFRVFAFETRRLGESRECPPRTVGFAALLSGNQTSLGTVGTKEAVALSLWLGSEAASTESAKEKVIFCSRRGETAVYQTSRQDRSAALCACGNATGAAAVM